MDSVLERINKNHFWKFPGGIHPPEQKFLTNDKPIKNLRLPKELILPLKQHIGNSGELLVKTGDKVLKGQALTRSDNPMSVPIHAPTSGTISAIKNSIIAHPSGMSELCVFLTPDGQETWVARNIVENFYSLSKKNIVEKIADAGIAGMGGAGFPTSIKVNTSPGLKYLIINAAECEPYITADDLLIREHSSAIINGIDILNHLLEPEIILIGIEDNKPQAIAALQAASQKNDKIKVCVLPTKYPTGGEKQLIQALTGQEVPSGVLPLSLGVVVQNIATVFSISEAIINDIPLLRRVVTVTGQALQKPQNVWALIGTPIQHLVEQCGFNETEQQRVIMGGPLMGFALPTLQVPVVKTTNCILAPTNIEISPASKELECIRCGQCSDACPSSLLPQELQWQAKAKEFDKLEELNLFDCIECGACAYVCPSQIPLVQYYRVAKAEIRHNRVQDFKADRAKLRFEARKVRLEKEKVAREEKHQKALAARKAAAKTSEGQANNSAIAAALARVKAKKAQGGEAETTGIDSSVDGGDVKSRAAQAIARAKAKKAAQQTTSTPVTVESDSKSQAAAAIARVKAKKLAKEQAAQAASEITEETVKPEVAKSKAAKSKVAEPETAEPEVVKLSPADEKKAKAKAAVAKAKAKKLAKEQAAQAASEITEEAVKPEVAKPKAAKPKVAKPKVAEPETTELETAEPEIAELSPADEKKAKAKAAVAKAKAKKLAKEQAAQAVTEITEETVKPEVAKPKAAKSKAAKSKVAEPETAEPETAEPEIAKLSPADEKKAKIAKAITKAKANKSSVSKPSSSISDDDKKKKISAAISKAKAKKATATINKEESE